MKNLICEKCKLRTEKKQFGIETKQQWKQKRKIKKYRIMSRISFNSRYVIHFLCKKCGTIWNVVGKSKEDTGKQINRRNRKIKDSK